MFAERPCSTVRSPGRLAVLFFLMCGLVFPSAVSARQRVVQLATLHWEPYVGEHLDNQGFTSEIVRAAFGAHDYEVEFHFTSWVRALAQTEEGRFDGVYPAYYSEERAKTFAMSEPFASGSLMLAARNKKLKTYQSLRDLEGLRIGVVKGYLNTPEFDAADYLNKIVAYDDAVNLKRLLIGRLDLVVIDRKTAQHILRNSFPSRREEVNFLQPPLRKRDLYVAFSRVPEDSDVLREAFNAGLRQIRASGVLSEILFRHQVKPELP